MDISFRILFLCATIISIILLFMIRNNRKKFEVSFRLKKKTATVLIIIFLASLILNLFITPHFHRWYTDEHNIMEVGKIFLTEEEYSQAIFEHPSGWPFLLSMIFATFGLSSPIALYATSIIASLTIISIFFLSKIILGSERQALFPAAIYPFIPTILSYAGTANNNIPSAFMITTTLVMMMLSFQKEDHKLSLIALFMAALASLFRPENHLLFLIYGLGLLTYRKKKISRYLLKKFWILMLIILLLLPNLVNNLDLYTDDNLAIGNIGEEDSSNWSIDNFSSNKLVFKGLIWNNIHPMFFTILYLAGIIFGLIHHRRKTILLLGWTIPTVAIFMFYFHVPTRFLISIYPLLAVLAGIGIHHITNYFKSKKILLGTVLTIVMLLMFMPEVLEASQDVWEPHKLESIIPDLLEKDIGEGCTVVAITPTIIQATTHIEAMSAEKFINDRPAVEGRCVLFWEDMYCDGTFGTSSYCKQIKEAYTYEKHLTYQFRNKDYSFYKLIRRVA